MLCKLNAVAREGENTEDVWEEWTGKTLDELRNEWKQELEARLTATG
jgi:hypothetical protein